EAVTRFGVGKATGVDLPGENPGILRPLNRWSALSNASISMGQEVALTALQLARVASVAANGGMLVTPRLVTRILHADGRREAATISPPVRVISEQTAHSLSEILVGLVQRRTATKPPIPAFT